MIPVAVALGSNLGDRERLLRDAAAALAPFVDDIRLSSFYDTAPVGVGDDQPTFLNGALIGRTSFSARELLEQLLAIEQEFGRKRPYPGAARTLDLDLILYGDAVISEPPTLIVPHPRFRERLFVLDPLAEIAGEWVDPVTGKTIQDLRDQASGFGPQAPPQASGLCQVRGFRLEESGAGRTRADRDQKEGDRREETVAADKAVSIPPRGS